jgi:putative sterol carrier protein
VADPSVKDIMEKTLPERLTANPGLAREIDALVHFQITGDAGGTWTLDCTGAAGRIAAGTSGDPRMVVTCGDADFVKIATKQLNANMAAMSGKLKFKPMDMNLALKLGKLLA